MKITLKLRVIISTSYYRGTAVPSKIEVLNKTTETYNH
eukprot:SAG11_NODE_5013_length_1691_cov_1.589824_1_plen_37_part_10